MEAVTLYVSALVDRDKNADVRLEAAMAKLWGTERSWEIMDNTMQIRGGRGFETAQSQADRDEKPEPVERFFRDARINTIFEGSSEIMRLFIAREILDPHLKLGAAMFNSKLPLKDRARAALKAVRHYALWYPHKWLPVTPGHAIEHLHPALTQEMRLVARQSRRLARAIFHAMTWFGPKLEREQLVLSRLVDIATELFVLSATISRAQTLIEDSSLDALEVERVLNLVKLQGRFSREIIDSKFRALSRNADRAIHAFTDSGRKPAITAGT
jgi:alkylation response protein AidB-like acyl-CoA dehydrogenase